MKLLGLHIYGFGKFEDYKIENISGQLQLIFGENEAGKSTLLAFIESILFGFSTRSNQRFEIDDHVRFGGSLTIEVEREQIIIERTKGKDSEVTIYYSDGMTGAEDDLKRLLKGMNRTSFRQIFFCNLTTLNEYRNYDEESWNQVLYEAGMSGGASLLAIEKIFDKRQGELFKPGGRKPMLNENLDKWESLKKSTSEWEKKNESYNRMIEKKQALEKQSLEQNERVVHLQGEVRRLDREKSIYPLLKDKLRLERELQELPDSKPFPEDGLVRMDKWKEQVVLLSGESESASKRKIRIKNEIDHYEVFPELQLFLQDVSYWNEQMVLYRARIEERRGLEHKMKSLDSKIDSEIQGLGLSEKDISLMKTTFSSKEELKKLVEEKQRSEQQYQYINEAFQSAKEELEKEENEYERIKAKLLSKNEREKIETDTRLFHSEGNQKWSVIMVMIAFLLFLALGLYERWILGFSAAVILLIGAFLMFLTKGKNLGEQEILIQDRELTRSLEQVRDQVERLNRIYLKAAEKVDRWEAERYQIEASIKEWHSSNSFPETLPFHSLLDAFDRTASIKKLQQDRDQNQFQIEELDYSLKVVEDGIRTLCENTNISYINPDKAMQHLLQRANDQREKLRVIDKLNDQLKALDEHSDDIQEKLLACQSEMTELMRIAETDSEEAFRIKGNAQAQAKEIIQQIVTIDSQLDESEQSTKRVSLDEIEQERDSAEREERSLMEAQQKIYQQLAAQQEQIRLLTEDGTYEDLLLQRKQKEDELDSLARKWSVMRVASDLLSKAKARYQEERLPAVISKAEHYFQLITNGRYTAILPPAEGLNFRVMHHKGRAYKPSELSRGTAEQLYLCIRLALASISAIKLPIFLDDIFVNFDEKRTDKAKEFIKEFSNDHQVILLTCHAKTTYGLEGSIHVLERTEFSTKKVK